MNLQISKAFFAPLARNPAQAGGRNMANLYIAAILAILAVVLKSSIAKIVVSNGDVITYSLVGYFLGSLVSYLLCEAAKPDSEYQRVKEIKDRPLVMEVNKRLLDKGIVEVFAHVHNISEDPEFTSRIKFDYHQESEVQTPDEALDITEIFARDYTLSRICGDDDEKVPLIQFDVMDIDNIKFRFLLKSASTTAEDLTAVWGEWQNYDTRKAALFNVCLANEHVPKYCDFGIQVTNSKGWMDQIICLRQETFMKA